MNALEKSRMICYGAGAKFPKDAQIARLREDFAQHFTEHIDYEPATRINDKPQPLIVSKSKNVVSEKKIVAFPGATFYTGDVIDCYDAKWLVTEVDQNTNVYTVGKMEQCNRELIWQNADTGAIIRRWCTVEKPYYSNLDETKTLTVSNREFKIQLAYDEETAQIDLDKRFMLELVAGKPKTYKVSSIDAMTKRFHANNAIRGFLVINVVQDLFNAKTDNPELMICDYIAASGEIPPESDGLHVEILYSGNATIRLGGSAKCFSARLYDGETALPSSSIAWQVTFPAGYDHMFETVNADSEIRVRALDYAELQGVRFSILASIDASSKRQEIEVIA